MLRGSTTASITNISAPISPKIASKSKVVSKKSIWPGKSHTWKSINELLSAHYVINHTLCCPLWFWWSTPKRGLSLVAFYGRQLFVSKISHSFEVSISNQQNAPSISEEEQPRFWCIVQDRGIRHPYVLGMVLLAAVTTGEWRPEP